MSLQDEFRIVVGGLSQRKLRSWLTVLGVVIGIAAIVALMSVSYGLEESIREQFESFGTDKINIFPGARPGDFDSVLNEKDLRAVREVREFDFAAGMLFKSGQVGFNDQKASVFITGLESGRSSKIFEEVNVGFREGASFASDSNKAVIGPRVADDLYEKEILIGNKIEVLNRSFQVVGILNSLGNPQDDSNVYLPLRTMRDLFDDQESISYILAKVKPGYDLDEVAEKTRQSLRKVRSEESFSVSTPDQLLETFRTTLGVVQAVLIGVAAISILVGSVGIASSMYTSVLERVRDIGIMKAVGARKDSIVRMFLMEAALVGFVGGVIGVLAGFGVAKLVEFAAAQAGFTLLKVSVQPAIVLFSLVFAVAVGAASGFFPASKASNLKPVDALKK